METIVKAAKKNNSDIKVKLKGCKNFNRYFGKVIDVADNFFVVEYYDTTETYDFSEIADTFIG